MRTYFCKSLIVVCFIFLFSSSNLFSWPTGVSLRTKKTTSNGCGGGCHSFGTYNKIVFAGPDTVYKGQSVQLSVIITRISTGKAGVDIAAQNGLLDTTGGGNYLKIMNGELVHKAGISVSTSITINFLYIAPNYVGEDTLYATLNVGYTGYWCWALNKVIHIKNPIGISNISEPVHYELYQNYPNPFNPGTTINYSLKEKTFVNLEVYNIEGKLITTLVNSFQKAGNYSVQFSSADFILPSGIYYYRLKTDKSSETKSMVLIK